MDDLLEGELEALHDDHEVPWNQTRPEAQDDDRVEEVSVGERGRWTNGIIAAPIAASAAAPIAASAAAPIAAATSVMTLMLAVSVGNPLIVF